LENAAGIGDFCSGCLCRGFWPSAVKAADCCGPSEAWERVRLQDSASKQAPGLAEQLVAGREAIYFRYFLRPQFSFSDADVAHAAQAYAAPDHLGTAFEFYRAFPANEQFDASARDAINVPIVFGSGEWDAFARYVSTIADSMRAQGCANVKTELIKNSVHYVFQEQPAAVAALIERYASLQ
jgi:pimeloyl-ACP methyl ester carboxylesterase